MIRQIIIIQAEAIPIWAYVGRLAMTRQEIAIMAVVRIIVAFRPMWSPIHPNINVPMGRRYKKQMPLKVMLYEGQIGGRKDH